jgi:hypothetical protein
MEKYNILEKLGDGTYGTVSKANNTLKSMSTQIYNLLNR